MSLYQSLSDVSGSDIDPTVEAIKRRRCEIDRLTGKAATGFSLLAARAKYLNTNRRDESMVLVKSLVILYPFHKVGRLNPVATLQRLHTPSCWPRIISVSGISPRCSGGAVWWGLTSTVIGPRWDGQLRRHHIGSIRGSGTWDAITCRKRKVGYAQWSHSIAELSAART